jgi:hypothetical protein
MPQNKQHLCFFNEKRTAASSVVRLFDHMSVTFNKVDKQSSQQNIKWIGTNTSCDQFGDR